MMNNRQGGEALINFVASRFKKGGPVAAFQVGGAVNDYESEAYGVGPSVSSTAASEDIGTVDEDRGPGDTGDVEDIDEDLGTFPEDAITPDPSPDDTGGDSIVSSLTTEQLEKAVDAIEKAKSPSAVEQDMLSNARAELSARNAIESGLLEDEKTVTQAAVEAIQPIDFLSGALTDASTPMTSGAFVDPSGRGVMADISPTAAATGSLMGASGAATDILGGYDRAMAEQRALANRDRMAAEMAASRGAPAVDADDMAGIGSVAPRSTVQAPPSGGIADLGPVSPDELDEAEDIRGRQAALVDDLDTADDLGPFGEEEILSGLRDLQNKKAGLAGLGAFAGSPIAAAAPFARDMFKTLTQPDVKAGELLAGKGLGRDQTAQEVVNEKGERIGVVVSDPSGVVSVQPTSIEAAFDPALRDAYSKLNERNSKEREESGRGDDRELITEEDVAVEEVEAPKKPPTVDIIPFRPQDFAYFTPGNFAYNRGLPSMMNMRKG